MPVKDFVDEDDDDEEDEEELEEVDSELSLLFGAAIVRGFRH